MTGWHDFKTENKTQAFSTYENQQFEKTAVAGFLVRLKNKARQRTVATVLNFTHTALTVA